MGDGGSTGPAVEIGTGTVAFEPLTEGQRLGLVAGPQGGHHFVLHVRMMGLTPGDSRDSGNADNPSTLFTVRNEDGDQVELRTDPRTLGFQEDEGGFFRWASARNIEVIEATVDTLIDRTAQIRVEIEDVDGRMASDEITVEVFEIPLQGVGPAPIP